MGLPLVRTPWVTFIDPDDFVDLRYFEEVDSFLESQEKPSVSGEIHLLACNMIFYYERTRNIQDSHPLRHRFRDENYVLPAGAPNTIQLSAASAFFRTEALREMNPVFDERRWMRFEDAHLEFIHK
jgi:GT2 family glycosyltransferase